MDILQPLGWKRPRGYSNGIAASGRMVFVAGMVGWNANEEFESDDLAQQFGQALRNIRDVLAEAGGKPEHICRLTIYLRSRKDYLERVRDIGAEYRAVMGKHFPVMAAVEVVELIEERALVEIEATAVVPDA